MRKNSVKTKFLGAFLMWAASGVICAGAEKPYSDHDLLRMGFGCDTAHLNISQLNVAQLGRLQIFPDHKDGKRGDSRGSWASTLRTVPLLELLGNQEPLRALGKPLVDIANDPTLSISEKNDKIALAAKNLETPLQELGFPVKGFKMVPYWLFNPDAKGDEWRAHPENFIHGPSYALEDQESYSERMKKAYADMFTVSPDIAAAQEVECGIAEGIHFTSIIYKIMQSYPNYEFTLPPLFKEGTSMAVTLTFFNKDIFKDVSHAHEDKINELKALFKNFTDSVIKVQIHALEHLKTSKTHFMVNLHADYGKANKREPYSFLNQVLTNMPGIVVAGDFNLTVKNKDFINDAVKGFVGSYLVKATPEPEEIGNPTYDAIFIGPEEK